MPLIAVQELPANGQGFGGLTFTQADVGGDSFKNTGREMILFKGVTGWTTETVQVEAEPGTDAGRDVPSVLSGVGAVGDIDGAGPFKPRNWNAAGAVNLTYPNGITGVEIAIVRMTTG